MDEERIATGKKHNTATERLAKEIWEAKEGHRFSKGNDSDPHYYIG